MITIATTRSRTRKPGDVRLRRAWRRGSVLILACLLAGPAGAQQDLSPSGMVAFFMTSGAACPTGWSVFQAGQGRLLVGVSDGSQINITNAAPPMTDQAAPTHAHSFQATATLTSKRISAGHCCNDQGAAHGSYGTPSNPPDMTAGASVDLPFIQLVICQKQ